MNPEYYRWALNSSEGISLYSCGGVAYDFTSRQEAVDWKRQQFANILLGNPLCDTLEDALNDLPYYRSVIVLNAKRCFGYD